MLPRLLTACFIVAICAPAALADPVTDCKQARAPELRITACSELIGKAGRAIRRDREELAHIYRRRGSAYLQTGRPAQAMADFTEAIHLEPGYALAYYERGQAALALGKHDQALADYGAALRHKPDYAQAYIMRGYVSLITGDVRAAIAEYSRLIELEPRHAVAFNNRGLAWRKKGDLEKALADYNAAIALNPRYALAYNNRGYTYEAQGKADKARADFAKALALDPSLVAAGAGLKRLGGDAAATAQSTDLITDGRWLVKTRCKKCHATGLREASPDPNAPPFRAIHNRYPILTLRDPISRAIAFPHRNMPKFTFSGEHIDAIIAYINSLPPGK
jgi:tetratricopeptide (TPR) repeat protein